MSDETTAHEALRRVLNGWKAKSFPQGHVDIDPAEARALLAEYDRLASDGEWTRGADGVALHLPTLQAVRGWAERVAGDPSLTGAESLDLLQKRLDAALGAKGETS